MYMYEAKLNRLGLVASSSTADYQTSRIPKSYN
jgi:hypothetical protein